MVSSHNRKDEPVAQLRSQHQPLLIGPGKALPVVMKVRPGQTPLLTDSFTDVFPFIIRYEGEAKFNNWQLSGDCD